MAINVPGLISIIILYVCMLILGVYTAYRKRNRSKKEQQNEVMVIARRDIGVLLGTFTMIATWIGGGVINGTSEAIYSPDIGFLWTFTPSVIAPTVLLNGLIMAKKMRSANYLTMLDPLQNKFGKYMGAIFIIPSLLSELFFCAGILTALGTTLAVILEMNITIAIIISSCISIFYTLLGGFYSVAYTDAAQLGFMFFGLYFCLPFAMTHEAVGPIAETSFVFNNTTGWLGKWEWSKAGLWIDMCLQFIFGDMPWQSYYQRVLSCESAAKSQQISYFASLGYLVLVLPPVLYGATAVSTDWNQTSYGLPTPHERGESAFILPIVLQHLTPKPVAIIGLAAICTAVMSSTDSSMLSASSLFVQNIYKKIIRPKSSDNELTKGMRGTILIFGTASCVIAILADTVFGLLKLCLDLVYVILFPQLLSVMYLDVNTYGSLPAFVLAVVLRIGLGEADFGFEPMFEYPGGDLFPAKTFTMLLSWLTLISVSYVAKYVFEKEILPAKYDVLKCNLANGGRSRIKLPKEKPKQDRLL